MTVPVTGRATYGDLVTAASHHIAAGAVGLALESMSGPIAAREAVASFRALLAAINVHTRALFENPNQFEGIAASAPADPREAAAVRFLGMLEQFARRPSRVLPTVEGPGTQWAAAVTSLRAATDLLSTHHDRDGVARTPESVLLEEREVRAVGLAGIGDLACSVLASARDLGLRAGEAGMPWKEVHRLLPDLTSLQGTAHTLAAPIEPGLAHRWLRELAVARPDVRTGDPAVELGDRLPRLRRVAWQLTRESHVGIGTLSDFAVAAVTLHAHAAAYLRPGGPPSLTDLPRDPVARRLLKARAAWSQIHLQSRELRTMPPSAGVVRADTLAILKLCRSLMPLDQVASRHSDPGLSSVASSGVLAFREIAGWNAHVLAELDTTGQLYLPARNLTGAEVTDHPYLVAAKLRGEIVRAPQTHVQHLAKSYESARTVSSNERNPGDGRARHALSMVAVRQRSKGELLQL